MAYLILWRHADAEEISFGGKYIDRPLTKSGRKDAAKMAKWLNEYLPANTEVLCSPAKRCVETAASLNDVSNQKNSRGNPYELKITDLLSVDSSAAIILKKITNDDSSKTMLLIGHQPNLGAVISKLLGMNESACVVKKGAVWWLRQRFTKGASQTYLFAVQHPDY